MTGPDWVEHGLAVAMIATAGYCAARLVVPRLRAAAPAGHRDSDLVHVAMATVMAAMLLGIADSLWSGPLILAFVIPAVWFAGRAVRPAGWAGTSWRHGHEGAVGHVQLSVASVAMVYMSGVVPGFGSTSAVDGTRILSDVGSHHHGAAAASSVALPTGSLVLDFALVGAAIIGLLAVFAVVDLGQLTASADRSRAGRTSWTWSRRLTVCCQLAMAVTTAHMLASMM